MSPTHANKKGARYRYYVSQALLQNRKAEAGSIARVPAPETEKLVCDGVRRHLAAMGKEPPAALAERELIDAAAPNRFKLCGLSMGGYIAFEMMRRAPDRVERLDTSAPSDTPEQTVRVLTKGPDAPVCKFPAPHFEFPTSGEEPHPASSMFFVAKFDGFVLAGRCAGRDRGRDFRVVVERQMNTNRRIAT
jgi:pimeloyl-ACP methyl ester carboxylesterase